MIISQRRAQLLACGALLLGAGQGAEAATYFERIATFPVYLNLPADADPASETVAEIVAATPDGTTLIYTDSPGERVGLVDISDPAAPVPIGTVVMEGEPTSVTVVGETVLVAVDTSESFISPSGRLAAVERPSREITWCELGGQPDSVAASPDGAWLAVAIENERDEELNDGAIPQLPAGTLAVFELDDDGMPRNCDAPRLVDLTGLAEIAPEDPEPEFVSINRANLAAVTLQENNHIALVDLTSGEVAGHFSAGAVDLAAIDTQEDGIIAGTGSLAGVLREPDAVAWLDDERLVTANEGDYEGGSRGFTIFARSGEVLYNSGNLLEHLGIAHGHYPEDRAENKGVEPEGVTVGRFGEERLIFVNAERGNFVAVFRDGGPGAAPEFLQLLPTAVGPEGAAAIPARDLLVVASEVDAEEDGVRGTLGIYARSADSPPYPEVISATDPATGAPIGWGALSGLVADPDDPSRLYAVSDSAYAVSRIFTLDVAAQPAAITGHLDLVKDGAPAGYDLEGIALRDGGGFWLVSEGDPEAENPLQQRSLLLAVAEDGTVEREIPLPDAAYEQAIRFGFEGVAAWGEGADERVVVAVQRAWEDDPKETAKLAIYAPAEDSWSFVRYPLEAPKSERGGWVGLSEITHLEGARFAVLERDNQPGSYAVIKTVTVVSLDGVTPAAWGEELPLVEKQLAIDLLPAMQASRGWISDKAEGLAVAADGRVLAIIDNDGLSDASGETMLLGSASRTRCSRSATI